MKMGTTVKFIKIESLYVSGGEPEQVRTPITARLYGEFVTDRFHCNWTTNFGSLGISQQEQGIKESGRVRMPYVKVIVDAMRGCDELLILKDGIDDEEHTFVLNSSVDDISEKHKEIEFQVKRWVHK